MFDALGVEAFSLTIIGIITEIPVGCDRCESVQPHWDCTFGEDRRETTSILNVQQWILLWLDSHFALLL